MWRRAIATLATSPGRTLYVTGQAGKLVVRTNMETYAADVSIAVAGADVEDVSLWAHAEASGDLHVRTPAAEVEGDATVISVPASFNVHVDLEGVCAVDVTGWLEGTVDVSIGAGDATVGTVRGLLTRVITGRGDVRIDHVEGNLEVDSGEEGSVTLGKIMGEDVCVTAGGAIRGRALYAKRLHMQAGKGVHASVLSAEDGHLSVGADDTVLDSAEGSLAIAVCCSPTCPQPATTVYSSFG